MPSKARKAFDENVKDVERLLEIHGELGGTEKGRRYGLEVLNKSAVVLITSFWEAYCEDIAEEALTHLVKHVPSAASLPKELKKQIAGELKKDANEIAIWDLADDGWKARVNSRLATMTENRNRKLNTPKSDNIDDLFYSAIGLNKISDKWTWRRMNSKNARKKLDAYISLRGEIAHRGTIQGGMKKENVWAFFRFIQSLCGKTGGAVNSYVEVITGKPLWS